MFIRLTCLLPSYLGFLVQNITTRHTMEEIYKPQSLNQAINHEIQDQPYHEHINLEISESFLLFQLFTKLN